MYTPRLRSYFICLEIVAPVARGTIAHVAATSLGYNPTLLSVVNLSTTQRASPPSLTRGLLLLQQTKILHTLQQRPPTSPNEACHDRFPVTRACRRKSMIGGTGPQRTLPGALPLRQQTRKTPCPGKPASSPILSREIGKKPVVNCVDESPPLLLLRNRTEITKEETPRRNTRRKRSAKESKKQTSKTLRRHQANPTIPVGPCRPSNSLCGVQRRGS